MKPAGQALRPLMSAADIVPSDCQVTPDGSFTRTPVCTGLPRDIFTVEDGLSERS